MILTGTCSTNNQINFKITMLKPSLCDHSDAYILVKGTIVINGGGADAVERQANKRNNTFQQNK